MKSLVAEIIKIAPNSQSLYDNEAGESLEKAYSKTENIICGEINNNLLSYMNRNFSEPHLICFPLHNIKISHVKQKEIKRIVWNIVLHFI